MTDATTLRVGFVVYDGLDGFSGSARYNRKLRAYLEAQGDTVEVINLARRSYPRNMADTFSRRLRRRLNQSYDLLLQDERCHPSLFVQNRRLTGPGAIVSLVHLLRYPDPGHFFSGAYRDFERWYLRSVDGVICTSRFTDREVATLSDVPSAVAYPGRRGIEPDRTEPGTTGLRVVFAGALTPRTGALTLVDALGELSGDWSATIVGDQTADSRYAVSVTNRVAEAGLTERVSMPGAVNEETLDANLAAADVLVVPSRYEGFPTVALAAMEHGTVPVTARHGGASELVTHAENGFLVGADDPGAVRDILARLQTDSDRLAALSDAARETAGTHPTWADSLAQAREFMLTRAISDD